MPPSFLRWPSLFGTKRSDSNANSNQDQPYRFRILIIGRANAGKTTILRAVCGAEGEPDVYDHEGNLVVLGAAHEAQGQLMSDIHKDDKPARKSTSSIIRSLRDRIAHKASKSSSSAPRSTRALSSILSPSALRGEHNIEYSLLFPSNRRFIFHDSRGFESGSTDELEVVRNFIEKHASEGSMKKQLHAIWYCFPADSNRIITAAEQEFFSSIDTGRVPVVAIFTKFDALDAAACGEFCAQGVPLDKAQRRAPQLAHDKFKQNVLPLISSQPHSPKAVVCLRNMHKMPFSSITEATTELIEKTVVSLDDDVLKQLLIQVQHINVELCIKAAVNSGIIGKTAQGSIQKGIAAADPLQQDMVEEIFKWFPYIWTFDDLDNETRKEYVEESSEPNKLWNTKSAEEFSAVFTKQLPVFAHLPTPLQVLNIGAAAAIVAALAFWKLPGNVNYERTRDTLAFYFASGTAVQVVAAVAGTFSTVESYDTPACAAALLQIVMSHLMSPEEAIAAFKTQS